MIGNPYFDTSTRFDQKTAVFFKKIAVFSQKTLTVLLCLSICCFVIAALFGYVGIYFQLAFCIALAALCLGVSLRVVKNVIAEAMRYKSENDLTI